MLDLGSQSFDSFSLDWYSGEYDPQLGTSPRDNMEAVYDVCADMPAKVGYSYLHPKEAHTGWWTDDQHVTNTDTVPTFRRGTWIPSGAGLRDAGLTQGWMAGAHDLQRDADGRAIAPRVYGAAVDIGAFERSPRNTGLVFVIR